jgi:phosphatidate cytidylyltransferase
MKRLATAAVGVPLALVAIFRLSALGFFLVTAALLFWAAIEFAAIGRHWAPRAPWWVLLVALPPVAAGLTWAILPGQGPISAFWALAGGTLAGLGSGLAVLLARTPVEQALPAAGVMSIGLAYFAVPIASLVRLQQHSPWLLFLLLAIVWLGDTAAYYVGSAWGSHRLAPIVSPKKSWEGAIAGFLTSVAATAVWSFWQRGAVDGRLLAVGAVTAIASQLGDLVESLWKRGAGIKDSGGVLPGHGGILDRMDAMLAAAPVMLLMLWAVGYEGMP